MLKQFPHLSGKLILAPMHNVTNLAFRLICKKYGANLVSTELLSANAIARKNNAVMKLAIHSDEEKPITAQIFSNNTKNMVKSAQILEDLGFDIIDINLGCPSDKIMKQGSGGALLKRKQKIAEIIREVYDSIQIPLTVKIRSGFDSFSINAPEIAKISEENGASAIIIHPRSIKQGYSGKSDWNIIKRIKENVNIPVIGNGDVIDGESAKKMLDETGCDYIMIGRAAIGNPFIFREINEFLMSGKIIKQTKEEKIKDYFRYIELTKKFGIFSIKDAKQKAHEFTKGLPESSKLRYKLNNIKSFEEIDYLIKNIL
ncbi:MAG: tRNA dihydrouridine synthase DusB [Nanoarchaeota archaeon]|nr:tRNA dihydrouridine synthase DusB [Nanoarchaeota archaeon]